MGCWVGDPPNVKTIKKYKTIQSPQDGYHGVTSCINQRPGMGWVEIWPLPANAWFERGRCFEHKVLAGLNGINRWEKIYGATKSLSCLGATFVQYIPLSTETYRNHTLGTPLGTTLKDINIVRCSSQCALPILCKIKIKIPIRLERQTIILWKPKTDRTELL